MKIVLDTNVLLVSVSDRSPFHRIFRDFVDEKFLLSVTTDILMEYEEILSRELGIDTSDAVLKVIENGINVEWITKHYTWNLIEMDPDDNKFVDCAIASNSEYIVTNDRHFDVLIKINFPHIEVISVKEFLKLLDKV